MAMSVGAQCIHSASTPRNATRRPVKRSRSRSKRNCAARACSAGESMCARPRNVRASTSTSMHRIRISLDRMPPLRIQPSQGVYGSNNLDRCAHLTPIRPFGTDDRDACTETAIQLDQLWSGRCYRTLEGALASYQPAAREQTGQHEVTAFCTMPRGYDNAASLQCIARRIDLDTEVALRRPVATRDGEDKAKATNNRV